MTEMLKPPTMTYEEIEADIEARGFKPRDLLNSRNHFETWMRANKLPDIDSQGKHWGSSQEYYQRYESDPAGADARPPSADLWQFLIKVGEPIPWRQGRSSRMKTVPICTAMFAAVPDQTEEEIAAGRERLEASNGQKIPDDAWEQFARDARKAPAAARRCIEEIKTVLKRHGIEHPTFGWMLMVTLRVSC